MRNMGEAGGSLAGEAARRERMAYSDGAVAVIAGSDRASKDARLSTGYGDRAIQGTQGA